MPKKQSLNALSKQYRQAQQAEEKAKAAYQLAEIRQGEAFANYMEASKTRQALYNQVICAVIGHPNPKKALQESL